MLLLFTLTALALAAVPAAAVVPGDSALYKIVSSIENESPPVDTVEMTALAPAGRSRDAHWAMTVTKADGKHFVVYGVSTEYPLTGTGSIGQMTRYLLRVEDGGTLEYRNSHTGEPLLPRQPLEDVLLPTGLPPTDEGWPDSFLRGGMYLGHALVLVEHTTRDAEAFPSNVHVLQLDPTLLVGTSRNFKDDGQGRPDPTANYSYVPLEPEDYDRLILAGHNYFMPAPGQLDWIVDRPVFFVIAPESSENTRYPEILYRSNWWGSQSFYDEPAIRFGFDRPPGTDIKEPAALANAVLLRAAAHAKEGPASGNHQLMRRLSGKGLSLGVLNLREPDIPIWETLYDTASYQHLAGAHALIHEGRYSLRDIELGAQALIGTGLDPTPDELFRFHFAFLRGAARVFGGEWGMSIYGQTDPALRLPAVKKAYDMGASFIWFWTSDHDHHMPFEDQISLAAALQDYADGRPSRDTGALLRKADTAVVLPFGYTMSAGQWAQWSMQPGYLNPSGTPYRTVPGAALYWFFRAVREGHDVDVVVDHGNVEKAGYRTLIRVRRDGSIEREVDGRTERQVSRKASEGSMSVHTTSQPLNPLPVDTAIIRAAAVGESPPVVDADLDDWRDAEWSEIGLHVQGAPVSAEDCSASVSVASDGRSLFLAVKVQDDVHESPFDGWDMWQGDCVQIAVDPLGQRPESGYQWDDHELGLALTPDGPRAHRWESPLKAPWCTNPDSALSCGPISGFPLAIRRDEQSRVTSYEASIPLEMLWPLAVSAGGWAGFNIAISDNDRGEGEDGPGLRQSAIALREGLAGPKRPSQFVALMLPHAAFDGKWGSLFTLPQNVFPTDGALRCRLEGQINVPKQSSIDVRSTLLDEHGKVAARWAAGDVAVSAGLQRLDIEMDSAAVAHGRYEMEISIIAGGRQVADQSLNVFVLPPPLSR